MRLAVIAGDGIGPEVVAEGLKVLREVAPDIEPHHYDLGAMRWQRTGELLPDTVLEELRGHDAILLGAIGDPACRRASSSGACCCGCASSSTTTSTCARPSSTTASPARWPTPARSTCCASARAPRASTSGNGGVLRKDTPQEIATEVSLNTAFGVERVVRYAFERAVARPRKHLTLIHKTNVLTHAGGLWSRTVEEVSAEFPEVTVAYQHVDAASMFFITDPGRYDVIVTDNLFGDIVTDVAAAVTGGIGLAASGNLDASGTNPSMFEPVHGSAPDIAGQGMADPTAAVLSVGLLLEHLGRGDQARKVNAAVAFDLSTREVDAARCARPRWATGWPRWSAAEDALRPALNVPGVGT